MNNYQDPPHRKYLSEQLWHAESIDIVTKKLSTDIEQGISEEEAANRLRYYGENRIRPKKGKAPWLRFIEQFQQPLVYILLIAGTVAAILGEKVDAAVIYAVVFINAIIGFIQESKAEKAIEALSRLIQSEVTVIREGQKKKVKTESLVPGDLVQLEAGDRVPADIRLTYTNSFQVDESALTGESIPVNKTTEVVESEKTLADRLNLAYAGTLVSGGFAQGIVFQTGDETETGRIARMINEATDLSTPLTKKIAQFSKLLLWVILLLGFITFVIGILRGQETLQTFMAAVALAVAAIPEGLPAAVTITLAIGVSRMAKRKAVIRKLPAVETLGSTTVICSDKTGTLTENQMTVREIYAGDDLFQITGNGYQAKGEIIFEGNPIKVESYPALQECLLAGALCNESSILDDEHEGIKLQGDPTEGALIVSAEKGLIKAQHVKNKHPRLSMIPFSSKRMFRATLHKSAAQDRHIIYKVGALEPLLARCTDQLNRAGEIVPINKQRILNQAESMAKRGLRVIGVARRHIDSSHSTLHDHHVSDNLTFLGIQAMMDPPRIESIESVDLCQKAGIAVKMITGDHLVTAQAIANQIGLKSKDGEDPLAITGKFIESISEEELPDIVEKTQVFARVVPEQKLRLVKALQSRGHIVAMTGDGVNDAPALKQADIGIAMGISGTEVAKNAADMILTDDNFSSIRAAVEEGRNVFDNLSKFIVWTVPTNAAQASILMTAILLGTQLPTLPVQMLWVNMSTAILLGLMLVFEPKEKNIMHRPPRDPRQPILTPSLILRTVFVTGIILVGAFWIFFHELKYNGLEQARSAVINTVIFTQIFYLFNCRSLSLSFFSVPFFSNPLIFLGVGLMIIFQLLFTYHPVMQALFHTAGISSITWIKILAIALSAFAMVEFEKMLTRQRSKVSTSSK